MRRRTFLQQVAGGLVVGGSTGSTRLTGESSGVVDAGDGEPPRVDATGGRGDVSVREALDRVDWWSRPPRSRGLPSGCATWPDSGSLAGALRATVSPQIGSWNTVFDGELAGKWTAGCQGLAFQGNRLFVTQNSYGAGLGRPKKGIYELDRNWNVVDSHVKAAGATDTADFEFEGGKHWGDLDVHDGTIYVALENEHRVVELDPDSLDALGSTRLRPPRSGGADDPSRSYPHDGGSNPWCAIHPWNGYLYTSNFNGVRAAYAYDPDDDYRRVPGSTIHLESVGNGGLMGVQGGAFSASGHLYLSSYTKADGQHYNWETKPDGSDWLFAFEGLTGSHVGRKRIPAGAGAPKLQELEGLTVQPGITFGSDTASVHTVLLDRNAGQHTVHFKAYSVPSGAQL